MPPLIDFDDPTAVAEFVTAKFAELYGPANDRLLRRLFRDTETTFVGHNPSYLAIDLKYHNFRHTLMATVCMALILEGQKMAGGADAPLARDFELAIAAVLLHDTGYLKLRADTHGTGAKYTYCHILRSCGYAASYLPTVGADDAEVEGVIAAINCTGPNCEIGRLHFRDSVSRMVGCDLATADYLGQLADPHYPNKLGELFAEFHESDTYANVPAEKRLFKTEEELVLKTPAFWDAFVRPRLDKEFQSVYRYLERPLNSGKNGYLEAVTANFEKIRHRVSHLNSGT